LKEIEGRTGKRRRVDVDSMVGEGGRRVVEGMVGPTVKALGEAEGTYRRVLAVQMVEGGA
jgi:hypothetical protein